MFSLKRSFEKLITELDTLKVVHLVWDNKHLTNGSRQPIGYFMVTKLMEFSKSSGSGASTQLFFRSRSKSW
jgi:hypothetical protein